MKASPSFARAIVYPLIRLLRIWLPVCAAACSWADVENFELRTTASFYGQAVTQTEGGADYGIGTFAFSEDWGGVASLTSIGIDPDGAAQQWTFTADGCSATVDATAMAAARNGDHVLWLDFSAPAGGGTLTRHFLIPSEYGGHALALVQTDAAGGSPVIAPVSAEGEDISAPGNFTVRRASALMDTAKPFWVVDFSTGLLSPAGATDLRYGWAADTASYGVVSVSFILDAVSAGEHYTLHWQLPGQAEVMQSLTAASSGLGWAQLVLWLASQPICSAIGSAIKIGKKQMTKPVQANMEIKTCLVLFLLMAAAIFAKADELDMQIRQKITSPAQHERDLSWISPELRPQIIARLKQRLEDPLRRDTAEDGLLTLNDEETIERLVKQYREGDHLALSRLQLSGREGTVSKLIEDVINGPGPWLFDGPDVVGATQQEISTGILLTSIRRSDAFPKETILWARNARDMLTSGLPVLQGKVFKQTQEWWSHNREAILAHKYENATWLPAEKIVLPFSKVPVEDAKRVWPPKPGEKPGAPNTPKQPDGTASKPSGSAPLATVDKAGERTPLRGGWALWAGIAAVLAAAAGWLWLRSKGKGKGKKL